jgi:hypothetical protein
MALWHIAYPCVADRRRDCAIGGGIARGPVDARGMLKTEGLIATSAPHKGNIKLQSPLRLPANADRCLFQHWLFPHCLIEQF